MGRIRRSITGTESQLIFDEASVMTIPALKDALHAHPFRPFAMHLPGRRGDITHPEQVVFPNDGISAIVLTPDGHIHILDVREINGVEMRPVRRGKTT